MTNTPAILNAASMEGPEGSGTRGVGPLTVKQIDAARMLGVTDQTIRNWERRGLIKGKRVRGVKLYQFEHLKKLVTA